MAWRQFHVQSSGLEYTQSNETSVKHVRECHASLSPPRRRPNAKRFRHIRLVPGFSRVGIPRQAHPYSVSPMPRTDCQSGLHNLIRTLRLHPDSIFKMHANLTTMDVYTWNSKYGSITIGAYEQAHACGLSSRKVHVHVHDSFGHKVIMIKVILDMDVNIYKK